MSNQLVNVGIGVAGLLFGSVIGYIAYKAFNPPVTIVAEPEIIKEQISDEELELLCSELTDVERNSVLEVQGKVKSLQEQLIEKEAELTRIKRGAKKSKKARVAAEKKWQEMEEQIAMLQVQLAAAEQERDELKEDLQETLVELNQQIKETKKFKAKAKKYKIESTKNLWKAFRAQAKVDGCNRGSKKRHVKCYDAFDGALTSDFKARFNNCVDTYQAVPVLKKLEKDKSPPNFSAYLSQESKFTKGWYIIFCDPTLPEARDLDLDEPSQSPKKKPANSNSNSDFDDDFDLDINFDDLPEN